jgi:TRAP-type C4-dicarboxylate transport system substrate-binding protein
MKRILAGCCLIFMVILAGCTKGQENKEPQLVLRYADNQPENYPTTKAAHYFASLVKERTEGAIEVSVFSNGELGSENSVLEQIQFGGVDFSRFSLGTLSNVDSKIGVLQMPYLYRDSDHMWRVLDGGNRQHVPFRIYDVQRHRTLLVRRGSEKLLYEENPSNGLKICKE